MSELKSFNNSELENTGWYPVVGKNYGMDQYPIEKYDYPITPKENWLRFVRREEFAWVPDAFMDLNVVCPDLDPDNIACGFEGGLDALGVSWIPVPSNPTMPAFVDPSKQLIESVEDWQDIEFPDVSSWDWGKGGEAYREQLNGERPTVGIMQSGFFERMISVCSFEEASLSFLECPDEAHELLDRILKMNLDILEHLHDYCGCDTIIFHDDWGNQNTPTLPPYLLDEFLVPVLRTLVDRAHELGMVFILHSCGNITSCVQQMIDAHVDMWQFNIGAVDKGIDEAIATYGDQILFHGYFGDVQPLPAEKEAFKQGVEDLYNRFGATGCVSVSICDYDDHGFDSMRFYYETARKTADKIFNRA